MSKKILLSLNDPQVKMLDDLVLKLGLRQAEILRNGLIEYHGVYFKAYKTSSQKQLKEIMTPEQICLSEGGVIEERDGQKYCITHEGTEGQITRTRLLSNLKS